MRIQFTIGIGFDRSGKRIKPTNAEKLITKALTAISARFGGCTLTRSEGAWLDNDKLIVEPGIVLTAECVDANWPIASSTLAIILDQAESLRKLFNQSSVLVSVNDSVVHFVDAGAAGPDKTADYAAAELPHT